MAVSNREILNREMLSRMYADAYFPVFLVDKIKAILVDLCDGIERERPADVAALLKLTHAATERINHLADEFEEHDSELETEAREAIAQEFRFIVCTYGFGSLDIEDVIAPREW